MGAQQTITAVVTGWPGVTAQPHRFGGVEYGLEGREIGHIHGDRLVDIPFPTAVRKRLVAEGRAQPHHILPDSGWVSFYLREPQHVDEAIALLQLSYDQAVAQRARRAAAASSATAAAGDTGAAPDHHEEGNDEQ